MPYSVFSTLFLLAVLLIVAGFVGRFGTNGFADVSENVAASLGLLVTYLILILSLSSYSQLAQFFDGISSGIPYLDKIADYGSLKKVFTEAPADAVICFLDTVILSVIIELASHLSVFKDNFKGRLMVYLFTAVVVAIGSVLLFKAVKETSAYKWVTSTLGIAVSVIALGSVPLSLIEQFGKHLNIKTFGALYLFAKSRVAGIFRSAVIKAGVYVLGIGLLEHYFGGIEQGVSVLTSLIAIFAPIVIMLIGLGYIVRSVF